MGNKEKKKHVVSFEVELTDAESVILDNVALHVLFADAFAEFIANRCNGNAQKYVDERYPNDQVFSGERRAHKVAQVVKRNKVAQLFGRGGLRGVTVRSVER